MSYLVLAIAPEVTLVSPENATVYTDPTSINFECTVPNTYLLDNISFYWDYDGSWALTNTTFKGQFGESPTGNNLIITENGANSRVNVSLTFKSQHVTNIANRSIDGNAGTHYQMLMDDTTVDLPHWIMYEFKQLYSISGLYQNFHSDAFMCENFTFGISQDNVTFYNVLNVSGQITGDRNDTFTPVTGKYAKLSCYNTTSGNFFYPTWYEIEIYGRDLAQPTTIYNATYNKTLSSPITEGTYNWSCLASSAANGSSFAANNFTFTLNLESPTINLTSPEDNTNVSEGVTQTFQCNASGGAKLSNISLYTDYNGTWGRVNYITKGDFGELGMGSNLTTTYNGATGLQVVIATDSAHILTYTPNRTIDANTSNFWQMPNSSLASPNWIKWELNDTYALNNITLDWHSDAFLCGNYIIELSKNDIEYTLKVNESNFTTGDGNHIINETNAKFAKLTCYSQFNSGEFNYATLKEAYINGRVLTNNATTDKLASMNYTLSGYENNNSSWGCLAYNQNNKFTWSSNFTLNVTSPPTVEGFHQYPLEVNAGDTVYAYCNGSDLGTSLSDLNATIEYRKSNGGWTTANNEEFLNPFLLYTIGDSITFANTFQTDLDTLMGSNSSIATYNKGVSGNTCAQIESRYNADIPVEVKVILMCGINDLVGGRTVSQTETDIEQIYNLSVINNNSLILMKITPSSNHQDECADILEVNSWITTFAATKNLTLVDTYSVISNGTDCYADDSLTNEDLLHPNAAGHEAIANEIWDVAFNRQKFNHFRSNITIPSTESTLTYDFRCSLFDGVSTSLIIYDNDTVSVTALPVTPDENSNGGSTRPTIGDLTNEVNKIGGISKELEKGDFLEYTHDSEVHKIKLNRIFSSKKKVELRIDSTPKYYLFDEGEIKYIDLNEDNISDLKIKLNEVKYSTANFTISNLIFDDQETIEIPFPAEENLIEIIEDEKELEDIREPLNFWNNIIYIIIFLVVSIIYYLYKRN